MADESHESCTDRSTWTRPRTTWDRARGDRIERRGTVAILLVLHIVPLLNLIPAPQFQDVCASNPMAGQPDRVFHTGFIKSNNTQMARDV